jgi:hypothetical protein
LLKAAPDCQSGKAARRCFSMQRPDSACTMHGVFHLIYGRETSRFHEILLLPDFIAVRPTL